MPELIANSAGTRALPKRRVSSHCMRHNMMFASVACSVENGGMAKCPVLAELVGVMWVGAILTWLALPFTACAIMDAKGRNLFWCFVTFLVAIPSTIPTVIYAMAVPPLPPKGEP